MDKHQQKYGVAEDEWTRKFHKSRRMFCVRGNKLYMAKPNLPYSHAVWFEKEGWLTEKDDKIMDIAVRGVVDARGDVYFYIGYDFEINKKSEMLFFPHLIELIKKLKLKPTSRIYGGLIKKTRPEKWPPNRSYGTIENFLKNS